MGIFREDTQMKTGYSRKKALALVLSTLLLAGVISACSSKADAGAKAVKGGDSNGQTVESGYKVTVKSISCDSIDLYSDLEPVGASFSGSRTYLLYTNPYSTDEDSENIQLILVLDENQNVIREIPYQANTEGVHINTFAAAPDGSYWTEEATRWLDSKDQLLRHYDKYGSLLLSIHPCDLVKSDGIGARVAAVDSQGRVYVTIDHGISAIHRESLALIDQTGLLVGYWDEFSGQLSVTILDDGTPIVYEFYVTAEQKVHKSLYKITPDGRVIFWADVIETEREANTHFQLQIFSGVGNEIFFEGTYHLYRMSLYDFQPEQVADWSRLSEESYHVPELLALRVESEDLMYGIVPGDQHSMVQITFEK